MTATIQDVTVDPTEMSETEQKLFTIIEKQQDEIEDRREENEELRQEKEGLEARLEAVSTRLGNLIDVTLEDPDKLGFDDVEEDNLETRLSDVEESVEEGHTVAPNQGLEEDKDTSTTPMEQVCSIPEHMVDAELTENQKRARFIAKDVQDYAEKAPAGFVIDSGTIKKVIRAAEGKKPHTQTVSRVMDFLDTLGKEDIKQKKRQGKKLVVVDPEAAARYHSRCDGGQTNTPARA